MYEEKVRKFGKTYGRYDGVKPALVTIDPELVKSIIVKNFDSFHGIIDIPVCTGNNDGGFGYRHTLCLSEIGIGTSLFTVPCNTNAVKIG